MFRRKISAATLLNDGVWAPKLAGRFSRPTPVPLQGSREEQGLATSFRRSGPQVQLTVVQHAKCKLQSKYLLFMFNFFP